jgi:hypothetical protein
MRNRELDLVDSIIILGYDLSKKKHREIIRDRLKRAVKVFDKNVKKIILSGGAYRKIGFFRLRKKGLSEACFMKKILFSIKKFKPGLVVLEEYSKTTFSNILYSIGLMKKYGLKRAIIVGDSKIKRRMSIRFAKLFAGAKDIKLNFIE